MEDNQVIIPLMGLSNCSDPITRYSILLLFPPIILFFFFNSYVSYERVYFVYSDCEKDMKEVTVMEESPSSTKSLKFTFTQFYYSFVLLIS